MTRGRDAAGDHYPDELPFAGIDRFLKAEHVTPANLDADVEAGVLGVPFDGGVTRRPGARFGPGAIRRASQWIGYFGRKEGGLVNVNTNRHVDYDDLHLVDCGDAPTVPNDPEATASYVETFVERIASDALPLVLGGDHYVTYPSFVGFARAVDAPVGVVQIDAHSDTVASSSVYGEHFHGSPMARIDESDYGDYGNHAMIGLRSYEGAKFPELVEDRDIHVSYASDVERRSIEACTRDAVEHAARDVEHVYVTVDVDAVDPAFAPGTGIPESGGLTGGQLLRAMDVLGAADAVSAFDLMEVAPGLDPTENTARLAATAVTRFLEAKFL